MVGIADTIDNAKRHHFGLPWTVGIAFEGVKSTAPWANSRIAPTSSCSGRQPGDPSRLFSRYTVTAKGMYIERKKGSHHRARRRAPPSAPVADIFIQ
jgi:hypothetical protein